VRKVKEVETGGKPTSLDEPIKLKSMINNVGFEIDGKSIVKLISEDVKANEFLKKV
jgi:hypothetical protein